MNYGNSIKRLCAACALALVASGSAFAVQVVGTGTGAIADPTAGAPACALTGNDGAPLVVSFAVSGVVSSLSSVGVRMNIAHTWRGDLTIRLAAPGGSPSHLLYSHTGSTTATGCGSSSDLLAASVYNFGDGAASNWWTTTATPTPAGSYRTSTTGGAVGGGALTVMSSVFAGLSPAQINGTWTLTFIDSGDGDLGTVSSATLFLSEPVPVTLQGFQVD